MSGNGEKQELWNGITFKILCFNIIKFLKINEIMTAQTRSFISLSSCPLKSQSQRTDLYLHSVLSFHSVGDVTHVQQWALLLKEISSQGLDSLNRIKLRLDQGPQTYVNQTQEMLMGWEFTTKVLLTGCCGTKREVCYLSSSLNSSTSAQKFHVLVRINPWVVMN